MGKTVLYDRLVAHAAGIDHRRVRSPELSPQECATRDAAVRQLRSDGLLHRLKFVQTPPRDVHELVDTYESFRIKSQTTCVFVVIDYVQLLCALGSDDTASPPLEADQHRVGMLRDLTRLTTTTNQPRGAPVLVLSEVRKTESGRTELSLSDLLGSCRLGYGADAILLLEKNSDATTTAGVAPIRLRVDKARHGESGRVIPIEFDFGCLRFREQTAATPTKPSGRNGRSGNGSRSRTHELDPMAGRKE